MFGSLGLPELLIIAVIVMLIFGPSQMPKLGRSLGQTIKEFRGVGKALTDIHEDATETVRTVEREIRKPL